MAIATTPTLLSLDRWAKIVGLNPVHFNGALANTKFPLTAHCSNIWAQYAWQTPAEMVSREEIAFEIAKAERDLKALMGYSLAPDWEYREQQRWPRSNQRSAKQFQLAQGKLIAPGVRGATVIEADAEVVFNDPDGDGWDEEAEVVVSTTLTDPREIKLFFAGNGGYQEFEIRPLRKVVIDADAQTATITADAWLFINPLLWNEYPDADESREIDISGVGNYVDAVDVYRIFNDTTAIAASFLLAAPGSFNSVFCHQCSYGTCLSCGATTQGGTFAITDVHGSYITPFPASYSDGAWHGDAFAACGLPTLAAFSYYAGEEDKYYMQGKRLDPLSDYWADIIAWMAAARLPRGVCGCDNIRPRIDEAQRDLTKNSQSEGFTRSERMDLFKSAFGTRAGEVRAWQAVTRIAQDQVVGGGAL